MLLLGDPSTSLTLLSVSSISECYSNCSLLRLDREEIMVNEMPVSGGGPTPDSLHPQPRGQCPSGALQTRP